ncbi:phage tail tape measure C-terminal domain-containing protein [Psychrobacter raelei]|uniref:Phage tail tape measure C-terminal domain-containing protein n=1 Tax=Psychrobacter raelei TaxID=2565531 RepID=A0AAT9PEI5_9GAMM
MAEELKFGLVISADGTAAIRTLDDLEDGLNDVDDTSARAGRSASNTFDRLRQRAGSFGNTLANVAKKVTMFGGVVGTLGTALSLSSLTETQRQFDILNSQLITATGGTKEAAAAFDELTKFASTTPYALEQSVRGFTQLKNLGLDPSMRSMRSYGNFAAAMGKDLNQMIEAVADASTFEFERLKEFGIKSSQEGDKVSFTFQGVTTTVAKNSKAIQEYLLAIGETKFGDAMANRAKTLDGALSNLGDNFNSLKLAIVQSGIGDVIQDIVIRASDGLARMTDALRAPENAEKMKSAITSVGGAFNQLQGFVAQTGDVVGHVMDVLGRPENIERMHSALEILGEGFNRLKDYASQTGDVINQVTDFFAAHQEIIIPLASGIGAAAGAFLLFNGAVAAWVAIGTAATAVTTAFGIAVGVATSPVTLILGAIAGLVAVGVLLYRNWDTIKDKATEVFNSLPGPVQEAFRNIKSVFTGIKDWAGKAFDFLAPYVKATMDVVSALFTAHWATIKGIFSTSFDVIKGVVSTGFNVIKAVFSAGINIIATVFNTGFELVKNTVKTTFDAIKALASGGIKGFANIISNGLKNTVSIVTGGVGNIIDAFGTLAQKLFSIGVDAVQGLINGVKNKISGAIDVARNLASSVSDTVKSFFIIRSPSRLFKQYGGYLSEGLAIGIKDKQNEAVQAALQLAQNISNSMNSIKKDIALFGNDSELASFDYDRQHGVYAGIKDSVLNSYRQLIKAKEDLIAQDKRQKELAQAQKAEADIVNNFTNQQRSSLEQYSFETSLIGKQADEVQRLRFEHALMAEQKRALKDVTGDNQEAIKKETAEILEQYNLASKLRAEKQNEQKLDEFLGRQQINLEYYAFETSLIGKQADEVERLRFERSLLNQAEQAGITLSDQAKQKIIEQRDELIELRKQQQALQDNNWVVGLQSGFQSLSDGAKSLNETMQQATTGAFNKMSDSFTSFVANGKGSFKDLASSILQDIGKMLTQWTLFKALSGIGGAIGGNFGSFLQTTFQAKGGGWSNGVQFYANGDIFNKPTAFRHAGGLGVMGEAGPEAVMPLTRGPNGKLGVQVYGNKQNNQSAGVVNQVKIDIHINNDGANTDVQTTTQDGKQLAESLKAVVLQTLQNEMRPGGMIAPA